MQRTDRCDTPREHREVAEFLYRRQIAHEPVDHEALRPAMARLGGDEVTQHGVHRGTTGIDDDDIVREHASWAIAVHRDLLPRLDRSTLPAVEVVLTWPVNTATAFEEVVALGATGVISDDLEAAVLP